MIKMFLIWMMIIIIILEIRLEMDLGLKFMGLKTVLILQIRVLDFSHKIVILNKNLIKLGRVRIFHLVETILIQLLVNNKINKKRNWGLKEL